MNPDLLRQRRNLITVSAVLLIFDFAQVKITKVSVLGTELLVGNAQVLMACAWILWGYFLLRYYQYWRVEREQHIRDAYQMRLDAYSRAYTLAKGVRDMYGSVFNNYKICRVGVASWTYTLQGYDPAQGEIKDGQTYHLPAWRLAVWSIKSAAFVCFQTPHATDHALPFALAIASPMVTLCTKWQWHI